MTADQLYSEYLHWLDGKSPFTQEQLFQLPLINLDVSENDSTVANRLYFAVPHFVNKQLHLFVFFEENLFRKVSNGDLELSHSGFYTLQNSSCAAYTFR